MNVDMHSPSFSPTLPSIAEEDPEPETANEDDGEQQADPEQPQLPSELVWPLPIANPGIKRLSFYVIFYMQLVLVSHLNVFLITHGFLSDHWRNDFHPEKWYLPLLAATWASGIAACAWLWFSLRYSKWVLMAGFILSPILSLGLGVMFIYIDSETARALRFILISFAVVQAAYACYVHPRFPHCQGSIVDATNYVPPRVPQMILVTILGTVLYSSFIVFGICGARAVKNTLAIVFIGVILLSMTWTMHVAKNSINVIVGRLKFAEYTAGNRFLRAAVLDLFTHTMGSVTFASAIIPLCSLVRGSALALKVLSCHNDGMFCSFITWYSWGARQLNRRFNRWSLVPVGVENLDFIESSIHTWDRFHTANMHEVIDTDLGGVFCFFGGLTGGAVAALVASSVAVAMNSSYAIEVSLYALLIGYFTCRIAMSWPQASLAAYYVGYAENQSLESTLPARIAELSGDPFAQALLS